MAREPRWEPGRPHLTPDPNTCPACGTHDKYQFRELDVVARWQLVSISYGDDGELGASDYLSWKVGDSREFTGVQCVSCEKEWATYAGLAHDQAIIQSLADWRDYHDALYDAASPGDVEVEVSASSASLAFTTAIYALQGNEERPA
jgi:hypothetical protein